jgi:ABC-type nitrate/sulfonate/bicarbonate transport system substrate-binding protein
VKRTVIALALAVALLATSGCAKGQATPDKGAGTGADKGGKQYTNPKLDTMKVGKTTVYLDGGKVYDPATMKFAAMDGEPSQIPMFKPTEPEGIKEFEYPAGDAKTFKFLCTSNSVAIPQRYFMFDKDGGTLNNALKSTGYKASTFYDSGDNKILPNFYVGYYDFAWIPTAIAVENWSGYESRQQELWKGGDRYVIIGAAFNEGDVLYAPESITSLKQLDGKSVGIMNPDYDIEAAFNELLKAEGLATESAGGTVKITMTPPAFALNDLKNQNFDASFARSGFKKWLVEQKFHELASTDTVWGGRTPATVLVVRKDILEKHPDVVQAVVQANYDATKRAKKDEEWAKKETANVKAFRLEYDGEADRLRTPEAAQLDAQPNEQYLRGVYDYVKKYGFFKEAYPFDSLVNLSFYDKVKK